MKQRLSKINRLMQVQQHLHRSAELQLAGLQRKESELQADQEELLQTMGETDVLHGLFVDIVARRLKILALEESRTRVAIAEQKAVVVEKALQVKRSERLFARLKDEFRQKQEKTDLAAILESTTRKGGASLP